MCNRPQNEDVNARDELPKGEGQYDDLEEQPQNVESDKGGFVRAKPPLSEASPISQFLFMWPAPLLKLGMTRPLEERDLPDICEADTSAANRVYFEKLWEEEKRNHPENPMLQRALLKDFIFSLWYVQPMLMLGAAAKLSQAIALGLLIESFEQDNGSSYLWASVIVLGGLALLCEHHHSFFFTWRKGMRYRIAAIATIYHKSQRLSSTHQETAASYGQISKYYCLVGYCFFVVIFCVLTPVLSELGQQRCRAILAGCLVLQPSGLGTRAESCHPLCWVDNNGPSVCRGFWPPFCWFHSTPSVS
jgi:hypothetical protein